MPYSGIPESKTEEMEACVNALMSDKNMKEKYPDSKERKSHSVAICHNQVMGKGDMEKAVWSTAYVNDLPDSSFAYIEPGGKKDEEGKTTPRSLRHLPYKDANGKIDPAHVRNALARLTQTNISAEAKAKAKKKLEAAAKEVGIEVSEKVVSSFDLKGGVEKMSEEIKKVDEEIVEKPVEEIVEEEVKEEVPVEESETEEEVKEETKETTEEPVEEVSEVKPAVEEEPKEEPVVEDSKDEVTKKVASLEEIVKTLANSIQVLVDSLKKQEGPAEGVPAEGETPEEKEPVKEEPVKEESKEEPIEPVAEEEPKEEVSKVDTSSEGASKESDEEIIKALKDLKERLEKVEQSPAPSKVVLYPKEFEGKAEKVEKSLDEVESRLGELNKMRVENPTVYMREGFVDEAFALVKMRKALKSQAN